MELFWQQQPQGQSLNLPVEMGDGERQGLAKTRGAVRQQQLFASKQGPHCCSSAREDGFYSRKAAGAQMPVPAERTPTLRSPQQGFAG